MSDSGTSTKSSIVRLAIILAVSVIVLAFIAVTIRKAETQAAQTSGIIEAITFGPSEPGKAAPERTAMVRLADGTLVQAHIATSAKVNAGQRATMLVYQPVFSAAPRYEVGEAQNIK